MMYLGAEDYYFWLGVERGVRNTKKIYFGESKLMEELESAYSFGEAIGKELSEQEYTEMLNSPVDYLQVLKDNYTKGVSNETYS